MYDLMIVEAPPKARKIESILKTEGLNFKVMATAGYIVDLPKNEYALNFGAKNIDVKWVYSEGKKQLLDRIQDAAKGAREIYIATDDDREGEKIANDLIEKLKLKQGDYHRVVFTAITKSKILHAIDNPRVLEKDKVTGAITRRIIDREIGYPVSEILRYDLKKQGYVIPNNLGVGRTISPTLHILNENQKEIDGFEIEEYYRIKVWYQKDGVHFQGLHEARFMKDSMDNKMQLELILSQMRTNPHTVIRHTPKNREESPPDPLITVTLQQSASNLYGFKGKDTMRYAQLLYYLGYISYHRTDSNVQSEETYEEIIEYLGQNFHEDDILPTKRNIKQKGKNVQEGHESIRPTIIEEKYHPDNIKKHWIENNQWLTETTEAKFAKYKLSEEHLLVYELIWYRTLAVQMRNAVYDASETVIDIAGNTIELVNNRLKTSTLIDGGEKVLNGWLGLKTNLLKKSIMVEETDYKNDDRYIPKAVEGEVLSVVDITLIEGKTRPPYNYGEGRLIRTIDNAGIVRPSTLATVLPSLESKKCIYYVGNIVKITRLGQVVDEWVSKYAFWLNDIEMAQLFEDTLDKISNSLEDINETDFIMEYHERINALKQEVGFIEMDKREPEEWQQIKALKIAEKMGLELGDEVLKNREKLNKFLLDNTQKTEYETLGKCPECKKGKVRENNSAFGCTEFRNGCKFTLWKKNIYTFFERFGVQVTEAYVLNIIIAALKKEPLLFTGLKSHKGKFDAFIGLKYNKKYSNWSMNLEFDNEKKEKATAEQTITASSFQIKNNIKNFRSEQEMERKLNTYFKEEGSASLCFGKIKSQAFLKIEDESFEKIGEHLKSFILEQETEAELFLHEDKSEIGILSYQPSSLEFLELMEKIKRIFLASKLLGDKKLAYAVSFRRFNDSVESMQDEIRKSLELSFEKSSEIIYKGEF